MLYTVHTQPLSVAEQYSEREKMFILQGACVWMWVCARATQMIIILSVCFILSGLAYGACALDMFIALFCSTPYKRIQCCPIAVRMRLKFTTFFWSPRVAARLRAKYNLQLRCDHFIHRILICYLNVCVCVSAASLDIVPMMNVYILDRVNVLYCAAHMLLLLLLSHRQLWLHAFKFSYPIALAVRLSLYRLLIDCFVVHWDCLLFCSCCVKHALEHIFISLSPSFLPSSFVFFGLLSFSRPLIVRWPAQSLVRSRSLRIRKQTTENGHTFFRRASLSEVTIVVVAMLAVRLHMVISPWLWLF